MKISLLILTVSLFLAPQTIDKRTSKKINKEVSKVFNIDDFKLEALETDKTKNINGDFFTIKTQEIIGYCYLGMVYTSRGNNPNNDDAEFFQYFILFNKDKKIEKVKIHKYEASYGQEITSRSWLKQFIGYNGKNNLRIGKEVDAMSGATLSSELITINIKQVSNTLNEL